MLIDAHTHLDHYDDAALDAALADIETHQILTFSNAMDASSYKRALKIARRCAWVVPSFGIHPWRAADAVDQLHEVSPLIEQSPLIGEIGLDYRWVQAETFPAQREVFEFFLAAAQAHNKIVNLHTKDAEADVLRYLDRYQIERAIIHWYSGPLNILQAMIERGFYFTVGVEVGYSEHIRAVAQAIPLEQLLTETDNPGGLKWLTGEMGRPRHLLKVIETLAEIKQLPSAALIQTVAANLDRLAGEGLADVRQSLRKVAA